MSTTDTTWKNPLPSDFDVRTAKRELNASGHRSLRVMLSDLAESGQEANSVRHVVVWLDWAAQLREQGMDWSDALRAAEVAYYG